MKAGQGESSDLDACTPRDATFSHPGFYHVHSKYEKSLPDVGLMIGQRRRLCANINPKMGERVVFSGCRSGSKRCFDQWH